MPVQREREREREFMRLFNFIMQQLREGKRTSHTLTKAYFPTYFS